MHVKRSGVRNVLGLVTIVVVILSLCCVFPFSGEEARANNEGPSWKQVPVNTKKNLADVFALDSDHVWAVGQKGTVLFYNGSAWSDPIDVGTNKYLYAVVAFDENDVWAMGDKVKVHWNGSTWTCSDIDDVVSGACVVPKKPRGGDPEGPYKGWATTKQGDFYMYHDSDWEYSTMGGHTNLAITANCEGRAWISRQNGRILTWNPRTYKWTKARMKVFGSAVRGISACGNQDRAHRNRVLAVGYEGKVLYSHEGHYFSDQGKPEPKKTLRSVDYLDESNAWAVGNDGTIIYSSTPPTTWEDQPIEGVDEQLNGVDAVDESHVWAVGDNGTVLQYSPKPKIIGCTVDNQSSTEVLRGRTYNIRITGSDTHFVAGSSYADLGPGIDVEQTTVLDRTHATARIRVGVNAATGPRPVVVNTQSPPEAPVALDDGITVLEEAPAPQLKKLKPDHGTTGTPITLSGEDFGPSRGLSSSVTFNGVPANQYSSWADEQIVCEVPSGATSGTVWVTTTGGESNPVGFTVDEPQVPQINFCYPTSVVQGSKMQPVEIHGKYTHFKRNESRAMFDPPDGITVHSTAVIDSRLAVAYIDVDNDAPLGARSITVATGTEFPRDLVGCFTIVPDVITFPRLDSLSTDRGSAGDPVTLSGQYFGSTRDSSYVSFNGVPADSYAEWSDTRITCAVPAGATTGPVTVTTSVGTSGGILFTVGSPYIKDCDPTDVVQGHSIDQFHILGDYTHFEQGKSMAVITGGGIAVGATDISDSTHATTSFKVAADATPGKRDVNVVTGGEHPSPLKNLLTIHAAPDGPPEIYGTAPGSGPVGSAVFIKGKNLGAARGSSQVKFNGTPATTFFYWSDHEVVCRVPYGASPGMVTVETPWGNSNQLHFGVSNPSFYFAEGTTRPGFDPYLCIQNPGQENADVKITYMKGDGTTDEQDLAVPPSTRMTVNAKDILGEGEGPSHDFSAVVSSTSGEQVVVERPQYFDYKGAWPGGSDAMGALAPTEYFFFAEGTCRPGFDPYLTVQNPGQENAEVKIVYMKGDGTKAEQTMTVGPTSRSTVNPKDTLGEGDDAAHDFSAAVECTNGQRIIAERPMYFSYHGVWPGGHDVIGARVPARSFYFAEGTTRPGFDPYLCIQNPCRSDANVVITYMRGDGTTVEQALTVPAQARSTVSAKDFLGEGEDPAFDFSCTVECNNNLWIVAERPMYFDYNGWPGGHDVVGALSSAGTFYFAEGTTRPGFDTYLCIQNPGIAHANVKITYMKGDGTTAERDISVPAESRLTVTASETLGVGDDYAHDFSTRVESTNGLDIVCERPMYFNYHGMWPGGHDVAGFAP